MVNNKSILLLDNGLEFPGYVFGSKGTSIGEICFNTSMTGYQEVLTDPSYYGQIVTMTYPHIGNYGINNDDSESSKIQVSGLVIKEGSEYPSNFRSSGSLEEYMKSQNITGIQGIDTRMLTRIIRKEGSMKGIISSKDHNISSLMKKIDSCKSMLGLDLAKKVSCKKYYDWQEKENYNYRVAALDFGIKKKILQYINFY